MIKFRCDVCQKKIGVPDHGVGRRVVCPGCGQTLRVPSPAETAPVVQSNVAPPRVGSWENPSNLDFNDLMPSDQEQARQLNSVPELQDGAGQEGMPRTCPNCHSTVGSSAVLCIHCGQSFGEGVGRFKTQVVTEELRERAPRREWMRSAAGLGAGAVVACFFSVVWVILVVVTHYQFGILAWGIGALVGLTTGLIARNPTPVFGLLSAGLAFASLMGPRSCSPA